MLKRTVLAALAALTVPMLAGASANAADYDRDGRGGYERGDRGGYDRGPDRGPRAPVIVHRDEPRVIIVERDRPRFDRDYRPHRWAGRPWWKRGRHHRFAHDRYYPAPRPRHDW